MEKQIKKAIAWSDMGTWLAFILYPSIIIGLVIFTLL
jgi:hypothetical protein